MTSRHLIHRQLVEIRLPDHLDSRSVQDELSRLCREQLTPLLDRLCSMAGGGDALYRLPRLVVDLGGVPAGQLEAAFVDRLEAAFPDALRQEIAALPAAAGRPAAASLELLATFLTGGTLPWWADPQEAGLLARHVDVLLARANDEQWGELNGLLRDPAAGRRLAAHLDDGRLNRLLAALRPARLPLSAFWPRLLAAVMGEAGRWGESSARLRAAAWGEMLALVGGAPAAAAGGEADQVLTQAEARLLAALLVRLGLRLGISAGRLLEDLRRAGDPALAAGLEQLSFDGETAAAAGGRRPVVATEAEGATFPLHNAGLVILWPFFSPLWEQLGFLAGGGFRGPAARQRAVFVSQALVTNEASWPEYMLVLNKLLSGLPLEAELEVQEPLTSRETAACEALLGSVIQQVPILGSMTPDQLRRSFLLRPGLLAAEAGGWLLRVERQTHDIVLERFPWPWSWVKLPWMADVLRVEW